MAEATDYIKLWTYYDEYLKPLSDVDVGRLVRAMLRYKLSGETPTPSSLGVGYYLWAAIKHDLDAEGDNGA